MVRPASTEPLRVSQRLIGLGHTIRTVRSLPMVRICLGGRALSEPQGGPYDPIFAGLRIASVINLNAVEVKLGRVGW